MTVLNSQRMRSDPPRGLWLDGLGITAATLCAVHCLAGVLFVAALPVLGLGALLDERLELAFVVSAVVLGLLSLGLGWRRHGRVQPLGWLLVGLLLLLGVRPGFAEGSTVEVLAVVGGAVALIGAHLSNHRASRIASCPSPRSAA
jgi:hypothetical protein